MMAYLRREGWDGKRFTRVAAYADRAGFKKLAEWMYHSNFCPRVSSKTVTIDGKPHLAEWLENEPKKGTPQWNP